MSQGRRALMVVFGVMAMIMPFAFGVATILSPTVSRMMTPAGQKSAYDNLSELKDKSLEGAAKGNLGSLRAGLSIYFGDKEGLYPADLRDLSPKYVPQIPALRLPGRAETADVEYYDDGVCGGPKGDVVDAAKLRGSGKWGYVRPRPGAAQGAPCVGALFIDVPDRDSKGKPWNEY